MMNSAKHHQQEQTNKPMSESGRAERRCGMRCRQVCGEHISLSFCTIRASSPFNAAISHQSA
eukprot:6210753-Pleurochrysis_carterae.AAC.1